MTSNMQSPPVGHVRQKKCARTLWLGQQCM